MRTKKDRGAGASPGETASAKKAGRASQTADDSGAAGPSGLWCQGLGQPTEGKKDFAKKRKAGCAHAAKQKKVKQCLAMMDAGNKAGVIAAWQGLSLAEIVAYASSLVSLARASAKPREDSEARKERMQERRGAGWSDADIARAEGITPPRVNHLLGSRKAWKEQMAATVGHGFGSRLN